MLRSIVSVLILFSAFLSFPLTLLHAQHSLPKQETLEVVVTKIVKEKKLHIDNRTNIQQIIEARVIKGSIQGKTIVIGNEDMPLVNQRRYEVGDRLLVSATKNGNNTDSFFVLDYVRRDILLLLFGIFLLATLLIGKKHGARSLLGMIYSFFIIFSFILPQIANGAPPVFVAIIGSLLIAPVTFYISHGFNKKTTIAFCSTMISIVITGVLAAIVLDIGKFSGFSSEEAGFIESMRPGKIHIQGLLLAGIIISVIGILDDVTVSQAAIVYELQEHAKHLSPKELYRNAMNVGKDHIASVVNTLILVYTGASLPLLLLFLDASLPFSELINYEIIAEEIVKTLVSSIGLIIAVPITTLLASYFASTSSFKERTYIT